MPVALVTGAAGQDGGYLTEQLLGLGYEVHAVLAPPESAPPWLAGAVVHHVDLAVPAAVDALVAEVAPDEVYNLAGISSVAASWQLPVLTTQVNALAVSAILDACLRLQEDRGRPVRVLQASSAEIFGDAERSPQDEDTPLRPVNPYGVTKAFAHQLVGVFRSRGLHAVTCVLYNHESPRRPTTFVTRKITHTVAAISAGRADELVLGALDVRRDWGWAPDYVDAMVRAVAAETPSDYVVATGRSHTVRDFVGAAFAHVGVDDWQHLVRQDDAFVRPADAAVLVGDAGRARRELGWEPTVTFEQVVARMVAHDLEVLEVDG